MKPRIFLVAFVAVILATTAAWAQTNTSGAVRGVVRDLRTRKPLVGATVVASSAMLQGELAQLTDARGDFYLGSLPPGQYELVVVYGGSFASRPNVIVQLGKLALVDITVNADLLRAGKNETIVEPARIIDLGSAKTGVSLTPDFYRNLPTGRTFASTLTAAAGNQVDPRFGTGVSGSTALENVYYVEGMNVTEPDFARVGTDIPNEFILETEVVTGAYSAEYGSSTGGVVNIMTKSGSNEVHGSIFSTFAPSALAEKDKYSPATSQALNLQFQRGNEADFGFELGAPLVKDKLWIWLGYDPRFSQKKVTRMTDRFFDENHDGINDLDADGNEQRRTLAKTNWEDELTSQNFGLKLSFSPAQNHRGTVTVFGNPTTRSGYNDLNTALGPANTVLADGKLGSYDFVGRWTSAFNNQKTEVDAVVGYHKQRNTFGPRGDATENPMGYQPGYHYFYPQNFDVYSGVDDVPAECAADPTDPNGWVPCPVTDYLVGGTWHNWKFNTGRALAHITASQRVNFLGQHFLKVGVDGDRSTLDSWQDWSGGAVYNDNNGYLVRLRYDTPTTGGTVPCGGDFDGDGMPDFTCSTVDSFTGNSATTRIGGFVQDSWALTPYFTVNAGVRYDQQIMGGAEELVGVVSPSTGEEITSDAIKLSDLVAPRAGAIWDPTGEGKSRVFFNWGRYFESVPLDLNNRAFAGEAIDVSVIPTSDCTGSALTGDLNCPEAGSWGQFTSGTGYGLVNPGTKAMRMDEIVAGGEYEVMADLKVGVSYIRRNIARAIEDMYLYGGSTMVIGNPGEVDQAAIDDLNAQADAIEATDPEAAASMRYRAGAYQEVGKYDKARRVYTAVEAHADKRFSKDFMVIGSYTYSRLRGNYPGLVNPDNGQSDPNYTTMYDVPDLLPNRDGYLPYDRTHQIKVNGYYQKKVGSGEVTLGASYTGMSGTPTNYQSNSSVWGADEAFLLPRGLGPRSPFLHSIDGLLSYGHPIGKNMRMEAFVQCFNIANFQEEVFLDSTYTADTTNPIVGGEATDAEHAKNSVLMGVPIAVNPNFAKSDTRFIQSPRYFRFGVRIAF